MNDGGVPHGVERTKAFNRGIAAVSASAPAECRACAGRNGFTLQRERLRTRSNALRSSSDGRLRHRAEPILTGLAGQQEKNEQHKTAHEGNETDEQPPSAAAGIVKSPECDC
jgi:hypothetical protein